MHKVSTFFFALFKLLITLKIMSYINASNYHMTQMRWALSLKSLDYLKKTANQMLCNYMTLNIVTGSIYMTANYEFHSWH